MGISQVVESPGPRLARRPAARVPRAKQEEVGDRPPTGTAAGLIGPAAEPLPRDDPARRSGPRRTRTGTLLLVPSRSLPLRLFHYRRGRWECLGCLENLGTFGEVSDVPIAGRLPVAGLGASGR